MSKTESFLMLVQTASLAAASGSGSEGRVGYIDALSVMSQAQELAAKIPPEESAREAAIQFCSWQLDGHSQPEWV